MDKSKLEQYRDLKREVRRLEQRLREMESDKGRFTIHDVVTGSNHELPYQKRVISVTGFDHEAHQRQVKKHMRLLQARKRTCDDTTLRVEEFISSIEDSKTRQIFSYRHICGYTWLKVAMEMGYPDESYPRRIHNAFLEKV